MNSLVDMVNESHVDIVTEVWQIAESAEVEEKKVRKIIRYLTPEEKKKLPFVLQIETRGFYEPLVIFRSHKRQQEIDEEFAKKFFSR